MNTQAGPIDTQPSRLDTQARPMAPTRTGEEMLAPDVAPRLGTSRARVLDLLRSAGRPLEIREISRRTGLHPNTARFHLDGLIAAGLAARAPSTPRAPGRPSLTYRAAGNADPLGERRYRLLAGMLASLVSGKMPEPAQAARDAGREWGARLTEPMLDGTAGPDGTAGTNGTPGTAGTNGTPGTAGTNGTAGANGTPGTAGTNGTPGAGQAADALTGLMERAGFAPETVADGPDGFQIRLHRCPFLEVASQHEDVICQLHLGLMTGALERLSAPLAVSGLEPFAEPGLCVARLTSVSRPGATQSGSQTDAPLPRPAQPTRPSRPGCGSGPGAQEPRADGGT